MECLKCSGTMIDIICFPIYGDTSPEERLKQYVCSKCKHTILIKRNLITISKG